ncbi:MAG: lipid-A-disaccharide synthase [Bacteroidales bacterium]|nr:lipid-A-disaccharide synthase [Bacteroidales bacterium]
MRYYIIAGEASGDLHGANLIRALKACDDEAEFRYWGGDNMAQAAGIKPARHIHDLAYMGFVEVVGHLGTVLGNIGFCKKDIEQFKPDAIVYIDYPGFNMRIEKWAHRRGYCNVHYISPQLWAWKKWRIKRMRVDLDRLCYILPFEQQFYADHKFPQATYVGHPLLDAVGRCKAEPNPNQTRTQVALLPGSRKQELKKTLPLMVRLAQRHPECRFVVAGMSLIGEEFYRRYLPDSVEIVFDQTYQLLSQSQSAVVCSGTATLETALFDVPQVVCYSANPISIAIAKAVVSKRIKYISLVNLIADRDVVTELIQEDFNDERLEIEFNRLQDPEVRERMKCQYSELRTLLGNSGASDRTAQAIVETIKQHKSK